MKSNLPVLLALIAGIIADYFLPGGFYFTALTAVLILLAVFTAKPRSLLLAAACGLVAHHSYNFEYRQNSQLFQNLDHQIIRVKGKISDVKRYPFAFSAVIKADSLSVHSQTVAINGKYQFFLNYTPDFNEGDLLTLEGRFSLYPEAKNSGEFDRRKNAAHNLLNGTLEYPKIISSSANSGWLDMLLFAGIQRKVIAIYNEMLTYKAANFQNALFLGVKTGMEKEDLQAFADSGTLHLLAVSGMHVAFLLLMLGLLKKHLHISQKIYTPVAIALLFGYTLLTGASPSVVRAFLMAAFFLLSYPLKRMISGLDLLAGAGIFSLLINPNQLFTLSFQLSYLAVLSILLIYQRVEELTAFVSAFVSAFAGKRFEKFVLEPVNISIAVSLGTLPLLLYAGSGYNLLSLLANVPLIPLTTISYLGGIILLLVAAVPVIGDFAAYLLNLLDQFIFYLIQLTADMDLFILRFKADGVLTILLFSILIYLLAKDYRLKIASQVICCGCLLLLIQTNNIKPDFYIFAADKGQAVYMNCSGEKVVYLSQTGAYEVKSKVLAYLTAQNIRSIDFLIVKGMAAENLTELCDKVKIRSLSAEFLPEIKTLTDQYKINLLNPADFQFMLKLQNGRIYFYPDGVMLQNQSQQLFCSASDKIRSADLQLYTIKEGRKKHIFLSQSGKSRLLKDTGGRAIFAKSTGKSAN